MIHCWDQKDDLTLTLKAHQGECTAVVCKENLLISTGKDYKLTIYKAEKGTFQFDKILSLGVHSSCSSIDYMQGKVLLGHDTGKISTLNLEDEVETVHNYSHHDGECWGLEIIPEKGTFLTAGDDNTIMEVDMRQRKVVRTGKVWTPDFTDGKPYKSTKGRSTASSMSKFAAHQQSRAICYSKELN